MKGSDVASASVRPEPFAYVASWTRKRSTARLRVALDAAVRVECECDSYHGFECSKHRRIEELRWALVYREGGR